MKKYLFLLMVGVSFSGKSQSYNAGTPLTTYMDIVPDSLLNYVVAPYTHETYSLNIFGDQLNDVEMVAHGAVSSGGSAAYISIKSLNSNVYISFGRLDSVFVPATSTYNVTKVAKPLAGGEQINSTSASWDNTTLYLTDNSGSGGGNKNVTDFIGGDKYIGLKFQNGSSADYAWIRVQCTTKDSCYVKDFSSTSTLAGMKEIKSNKLSLYPNPFKDHIQLKHVDLNVIDITNIKLLNVCGAAVNFTYESKGEDLRINIGELANGCYFLVIPNKSGEVTTKKLFRVGE
jgi:hypothetical protein